MTRKEGVELHNTIIVTLLDTTVESSVKVTRVVLVTIAVSNDTRVHSSGVAMPDFQVCFGHGIAGVDINDLNVQSQGHTRFIVSDVLAD